MGKGRPPGLALAACPRGRQRLQVKRDFACTFTRHFDLCSLSCRRSHALAGGAGPVPLRGASPGLERGSSSLKVSGGVAASFWLWRARSGGAGLVLAGAAPGTVALAVQQQVVAGVEHPVQDGLADDRVGEQRIPV